MISHGERFIEIGFQREFSPLQQGLCQIHPAGLYRGKEGRAADGAAVCEIG